MKCAVLCRHQLSLPVTSHTRKENLTHTHTHTVAGHLKLGVEARHLRLTRRENNPTLAQHHARFLSILYKCDGTDCSAGVSL